jgi:hypothetical protein
MKKVLATVAALGLVVGVTANALALDKPSRATEVEATTAPAVPKPTAPGVALWSVSGQWVLAGAYLSRGLGAPGAAAVGGEGSSSFSDSSDAFYIYSFKILPVLQINDKVAVKGELRFADRDVFGISNRVLEASDGRIGGRVIDAYTVYMEYVSPVGKTRFGRAPAGAWGTSKWNNSSRQGDRLMWWTNFMPENWGMLIFTEKLSETDAGTLRFDSNDDGTDDVVRNDISDGDQDAYYIDLSYKADVGKTVGALWFVRNANNAAEQAGTTSPYNSIDLWLNGKYAFGDIGFEWELDYRFGDGPNNTNRKALGLMMDLVYNTGDFQFGALYYYGSGDDNLSDDDTESFMANSAGMGRDYNPYQIMNGDYMNMLNADNPLSGNSINPAFITGPGSNTGAWSLGIHGAWKMSPDLSFSGEIGYFQANEPRVGQDDEIGWEIGVGMGYKIYNNLSYNAHFSYLATGDFFKQDPVTGDYGSVGSTEDVYLFAHALSMKF